MIGMRVRFQHAYDPDMSLHRSRQNGVGGFRRHAAAAQVEIKQGVNHHPLPGRGVPHQIADRARLLVEKSLDFRLLQLSHHILQAPLYGNSATCSSPVASGKPSIKFMFCTACPDAPFTRLSSVEAMMARPSMRSAATPIMVMLEPRTCRLCGVSPKGSTCTKSSL